MPKQSILLLEDDLQLSDTIKQFLNYWGYEVYPAYDAIRMIDNLLSNAIKYNKKEGIINITLTKNRLSILDSGIGIKKEDIELIHGRFKRANMSEGGFGIGLDIVNQVVERYGFRFHIISIYTKNTEVIIEW